MDTIQIFGCSDRINELGDSIPDILKKKKHPSIGLNRFPEFFPFVDYWLFVDSAMADRIVNGEIYKNQQILTCRHIYNFWFKNRPEFRFHTGMSCEKRSKAPLSSLPLRNIFEPNDLELKIGNSAYYALEWAVSQGYKRALLYGILDSDYAQTGKDIKFKHFFGGSGTFPAYKFPELKQAVESNLNGRIEIIRPLRIAGKE